MFVIRHCKFYRIYEDCFLSKDRSFSSAKPTDDDTLVFQSFDEALKEAKQLMQYKEEYVLEEGLEIVEYRLKEVATEKIQ